MSCITNGMRSKIPSLFRTISTQNKRCFTAFVEKHHHQPVYEGTTEETLSQIRVTKERILSMYPDFVNSIDTYFPNSMLMSEYFFLASDITETLGFVDNTIGLAAICRDEIVEGMMQHIQAYWGKTFNCCSLAGFVTMGKTGLEAAIAHCPIDENDGKRRFVLVAMPHIAISGDGEIGKCHRTGIPNDSIACGSLQSVVNEIKSGHLHMELNMADIEQSIVKQRILSEVEYGQRPTLDQVTKIALNIITEEVDKLLTDNLHVDVYEYIVLTGVQINGPEDLDWIFPSKCWHATNTYESNRQELTIPLPTQFY